MKHKSLKIGAAALVCVMLLSVFAFSLVSYLDSDGNDPLVTLSYLTDVLLPQFKKDVLMEVANRRHGIRAGYAADTGCGHKRHLHAVGA